MDRLQKARTLLVFDHPWLASLVMRLDTIVVESGDPHCPVDTASTDGRYIYVCAAFIDGLSQAEIIGLYAHEALHCALQHFVRYGDRDNIKKWNVACDYAINPIIVGQGITLPDGALIDPQYAGLSAEEIYARLRDSSMDDLSAMDEMLEGPPDPALANEWKNAMADAIAIARRAGPLAGSLARLWDDIRAPAIPWRELLAAFAQSCRGREDYTWSRPSRRALSHGAIMPGWYATELQPIAVCVDTSGSIDREMVSQAIAILRSVAEFASIIVIYADATVHHIDHVDRGRTYVPKNVTGGGGTDFGPAVRAATRFNVAAICYLSSDMCGQWPLPTTTPLLWLTTAASHPTPPFGETIVVKFTGPRGPQEIIHV